MLWGSGFKSNLSRQAAARELTHIPMFRVSTGSPEDLEVTGGAGARLERVDENGCARLVNDGRL